MTQSLKINSGNNLLMVATSLKNSRNLITKNPIVNKMENSVKTSDEILNELFESIKPNEDNEASEASVSLSEGEEASSHKKSKKSKKDKKSKKKKKEKKKKRSPEPRKSRPLSPPVQDRSRRDHAHESGMYL